MDTLVKSNVTTADTLLTVDRVSHSYAKDMGAALRIIHSVIGRQ